jgi:hypothetical protein
MAADRNPLISIPVVFHKSSTIQLYFFHQDNTSSHFEFEISNVGGNNENSNLFVEEVSACESKKKNSNSENYFC